MVFLSKCYNTVDCDHNELGFEITENSGLEDDTLRYKYNNYIPKDNIKFEEYKSKIIYNQTSNIPKQIQGLINPSKCKCGKYYYPYL